MFQNVYVQAKSVDTKVPTLQKYFDNTNEKNELLANISHQYHVKTANF